MLSKFFSICFLSRAFSLCVVSLEHGALRPVCLVVIPQSFGAVRVLELVVP
jgi:hypothetical protein